ncbi:MAG: hypothetical protein KBD78_04335 [Oligoflexales bacterium]|nr:hypothetical protein [Oligoflexales bacterium]
MSFVYKFFAAASFMLLATSSWCSDLDKHKNGPSSSASADRSPSVNQSEKHSRIEVLVKNNPNIVEFKVVPNSGLVINTEGPWSLVVDEKSPLKFKKTQFKVADFDAKLPGFRGDFSSDLKITTKARSSTNYKMIVFVCTANKKVCYRDVHENTF